MLMLAQRGTDADEARVRMQDACGCGIEVPHNTVGGHQILAFREDFFALGDSVEGLRLRALGGAIKVAISWTNLL